MSVERTPKASEKKFSTGLARARSSRDSTSEKPRALMA